MQKKFAVAVLLVVLMAVGAWLALHRPTATVPALARPAAMALPANTLPTAPEPTDSRAQRKRPVASTLPAAPLPPADEPLNRSATDLLRRAQAGDMRAACRLGIELLRCRRARVAQRAIVSALPVQVAGDSREMMLAAAKPSADELKFMTHALDAADACSDIGPAMLDQGSQWLRRAADAGRPDAMAMFAEGAGFDAAFYTDYGLLHSPDFDYWRQQAPAMLQRALALGSEDAAIALANATDSDYPAYAALIPDDPVQHKAYQILLMQLRPGTPAQLRVLSPEQEAQAQTLAKDLFERDFHGRSLPPARAPGSAMAALQFKSAPDPELCHDGAP